MKGIKVRVFAVATLAMAFVLSAMPAAANTITHTFNFQSSVKPWVAQTDKLPVNEHTLVIKEYLKGDNYAAMSTTGADSVWMVASFLASPNPAGSIPTVKVAFDARNFGTSGTEQPIVYVGSGAPPSILAFKDVGKLLNENWQTYSYEQSLYSKVVWVAIGYRTDKPNWAGFDNIIVKMDNQLPSPTGPADITVQPSANQSYLYTFAATVSPWTPFGDGFPVNEHTLVLKKDETGNGYAAMTMVDSIKDPSGVWMMHSFPTTTNSVKVAFAARNFEGSGKVQPVIFVGSTKPVSILEFKPLGEFLTDKWQAYEYIVPMKASTTVVAVGYMADGANWAGIDNLAIKFFNQ
jgi:hypothetical protein